jgi:tRNA threonylcarbamoyl adenosine modification protein YeaZ
VTARREPASAADSATTRSDGRRDWLLAIDTATTRAIVAAGAPDGSPLGVTTWVAGRTHGEQLLPAIGRLHGEANLRRSRIRGVIVGTGPGAFTGLRVGIATAKALAHELGVPIVGVSTGAALLAAAAAAEDNAGRPADPKPVDVGARAATRFVLLLPAGPNDRLAVRAGVAPVLLPGGTDPDLLDDEVLVAVDLDGRAPADAVARGERARDGLAPALVGLGAARLRTGDVDDLARLVPEYVSLPRGVRAETGEVAWSRDHR